MESVRLLVVTPTKNRLELLKRAVASVQAQQYPNWRLVIINDGSDDGTQAYLDELTNREDRITAIHNFRGRGVNAARNAAFTKLQKDEFVVFLDDDDYFEPDAFTKIKKVLGAIPQEISVVCFNTFNVTKNGRFEQGYTFGDSETHRIPTYFAVMTKKHVTGDSLPLFRASLYLGAQAYLYPEDLNGFETETFSRMVRDGIGVWYVPVVIANKDHSHDKPHLSDYAARTDPASFVRANIRIFQDHAEFFTQYPGEAMKRAVGAFKVAVRAADPLHVALFGIFYIRALALVILGKGKKDEE